MRSLASLLSFKSFIMDKKIKLLHESKIYDKLLLNSRVNRFTHNTRKRKMLILLKFKTDDIQKAGLRIKLVLPTYMSWECLMKNLLTQTIFRSGLNSQVVSTDILRVKQCFPTALSLDCTSRSSGYKKIHFSFCTMKYSFPKMSILMLKKTKS